MSREYKVVVKSVDSGTKLVWVLILFHLSVNSLSVVEASDKGGPLEKGMAKPLQYSCLENPHEQRSLAGYSPWGCRELDTTERLSTA